MFVGHTAVALAAKARDPRASLGVFVAAAYAIDLIWPLFLLLGLERVCIDPGNTAFTPLAFDSYPWSHSLLMASVWGLALAGLARARGIEARGAALIGALVVSHWVLDFVTHAPDMPLWPGRSPRLGLGLWNSIAGTFVVEGVMWATALVLYLRGRRARSWVGRIALGSLVVLCTLMWASGPWAAPPPSARFLAWFALVGWIMVPWAAWVERGHRDATAE
jgi:hypothetical protein